MERRIVSKVRCLGTQSLSNSVARNCFCTLASILLVFPLTTPASSSPKKHSRFHRWSCRLDADSSDRSLAAPRPCSAANVRREPGSPRLPHHSEPRFTPDRFSQVDHFVPISSNDPDLGYAGTRLSLARNERRGALLRRNVGALLSTGSNSTRRSEREEFTPN